MYEVLSVAKTSMGVGKGSKIATILLRSPDNVLELVALRVRSTQIQCVYPPNKVTMSAEYLTLGTLDPHDTLHYSQGVSAYIEDPGRSANTLSKSPMVPTKI